jgi:hypothetical protein
MPRLFDRYIVVDWSARNAPARGADSIWIAQLAAAGPVALSNPPTRHLAERQLSASLAQSPTARVLVTIDVALGYPAGSSAMFGLEGASAWRAMWDAIARLSLDDPSNRNNRFDVATTLNRRAGHGPGPFWGCPRAASGASLTPTKPTTPPVVGDHRISEHLLRTAGSHPKSVWQLLGAGSVGGQSLTAIPMLRRLVDAGLDVWPFTTGLQVPNAGAQGRRRVVAEIWPSRFVTGGAPGAVKDAVQVEATALALRTADRADELIRWFRPDVDAETAATAVAEEGWILGAPTA